MNETFERGRVSQAGRAAGSMFYVDFFHFFFFHERLGRVVNSNSNQAKLSPPLPAWGQVELTPRDVPSPCPLWAPKGRPTLVFGETCTPADAASIWEIFPDAARILLTTQTFVAPQNQAMRWQDPAKPAWLPQQKCYQTSAKQHSFPQINAFQMPLESPLPPTVSTQHLPNPASSDIIPAIGNLNKNTPRTGVPTQSFAFSVISSPPLHLKRHCLEASM